MRMLGLAIWLGASAYVLFAGVLWLFAGMLLLFGCYLFFQLPLPVLRKLNHHAWFYVPLYLLIAAVAAITIKVFILEICVIPSGSMENTLFPQDRVIINKLSYGPRMPRSIVEIPWLHGVYLLFKGKEAYIRERNESKGKTFRRLKGFSGIRKGDVIVFESPATENLLLVKRVVASPGDTLFMQQGELYINGVRQIRPQKSKITYQLWPKDREKALGLLEKRNIEAFDFKYEESESWYCVLDEASYSLIQDSNYFDSLRVVSLAGDSFQGAWHDVPLWTKNNFGPIIIPSKGFRMEMNAHNVKVYGKLIKTLEHASLEGREFYTFQQNYYFSLGDNRSYSIDSRLWGLIPEDLIVGQGSIVLFSGDENLSFFNRVLKSIN